MPGIETMFLATSIKWSYLSSTIVRKQPATAADISKFVTPNVESAVSERWPARQQGRALTLHMQEMPRAF